MIEVLKATIDSPPEIAGKYEDYQVTPFGETSLSYRIIVPADLAPIEVEREEVAQGGPMVVGAFESDGDPAHRLEVSVVSVGREVDVYDYCSTMADLSGLEVREMDWIDANGKTGVEYSIRFGEGPGERVTRVFAFAEGPRIFIVSLTVPPADDEARLDAFALARDGFEPLAPSGEKHAEPFETFEATGDPSAPPLAILWPSSWTLEEAEDAPPAQRMISLTLVEEDAPRATIGIQAVPRAEGEGDLRAFAAALFQDAARAGFTPAGEAEYAEFDPPAGAGFEPGAIGARRQGSLPGGDAEVLAVALRSPKGTYGATAILPAPAQDTIGWLAGKRALDVLVQSLNQPPA